MRNRYLKFILVVIAIVTHSIVGHAQERTDKQGRNLKTQLKEGINLIETENFKAAKKHFKKLIKSYPNQLDPKYFLAVSEYLTCKPWSKKLSNVVESFDALIVEYPNESKLYFRRALAKLLVLKNEEALADLVRCKEISSIIPETNFFLGHINLNENFYNGPNLKLHHAMKNFELFMELIDSTHILFNTAAYYKAVSQQKNGLFGFSSFEQGLLSNKRSFLSRIKPNVLFPLDTTEQIICSDLNSQFGILKPLRLDSLLVPIQYYEFLQATKLSDLVEIDDILSFEVVGTRKTFNINTQSAEGPLIVISNKRDEFSENVLKFFNTVTPGEYFSFENIVTRSGKKPNFGYRFTFKNK